MEVIRKVFYLIWILLKVFGLCHSLNTTSLNDSSDMISMIETAISGNTALHLHQGGSVNVHEGTPMLDMTRSTWSLPGGRMENDTEQVLNSVPLPNVISAVLDSFKSTKTLHKITAEDKLDVKHSLNELDKSNSILPENITELNNETVPKSNSSTSGFYIPFEKLSRLKRQARNNSSSNATPKKRARVLLLMNRKPSNNTRKSHDSFPSKVLMLVKKPNASAVQQSGFGSRQNLHEIVYSPQTSDPKISEVTQSQPAIQKISDLHKIELPLKPLEFTTENSSLDSTQGLNNPHSLAQDRRNSQNSTFMEQINNTPSLLDVQQNHNRIQNNQQSNNRQSQPKEQNMQSSSNIHTINVNLINSNGQPGQRFENRQTGSQTNSNQQTSHSQSAREPSSSSNSKQLIRNSPVIVISQSSRRARLPVERQMTIQPAVSSNRISVSPVRTARRRTTVTSSRPNRPLVRAISSRNLNQQRSQRINTPQVRQTPRQSPGQAPRQTSRQTQRQTARQTPRQTGRQTQTLRRRTSARRQPVRRRPSPPDPFTRRFSAGFQRGSNLLHQPPIDLTSFGGTGFNTLSPAQTRLPPFRPPIGMFGGIGMPGIFPGPPIL